MQIPEASKRWMMHLEQKAKIEKLETKVQTMDERLTKLENPPKAPAKKSKKKTKKKTTKKSKKKAKK